MEMCPTSVLLPLLHIPSEQFEYFQSNLLALEVRKLAEETELDYC